MVIHARIAALFQALDDAELRWCVVRSAAELEDPTGDVDLLVHGADLSKVVRIAASLGFADVPAWGRGSHRFLVAYDPRSDRWIKLDVVSEFAFGAAFSLATPAAEPVLDRRCRVGDVFTLAQEDEFWALLLHAMLDKGEINAAERARLQHLAPSVTAHSPLANTVRSYWPRGWDAASVLVAVRHGEWTRLKAMPRDLTACWQRRDVVEVVRRRVVGSLAVPFARLRRGHDRADVRMTITGGMAYQRARVAEALGGSFYVPVRATSRAPGTKHARHGARERLIISWAQDAAADTLRSGGRADVAFDIEQAPDDAARVRLATAAAWEAFVARWAGRDG